VPPRRVWTRPEPPGRDPDDKVLYRATGEILGTIRERKEQAKMARVVGTGTDPLGRYPEGIIGDFPDGSPELQSVLDLGWVREFDPASDYAENTKWQVANAIVRNDAVVDPVEAEVAKDIGEDAAAIVHEGNVDSTAAELQSKQDEIDEPRDEATASTAYGADTTIGSAAVAAAAEADKPTETKSKKG
jgi:hypothetical protein